MESGRLKRLFAFLIEGAFGLALVLLPVRWMDRTGMFDIVEEDHVRNRWVGLEAMEGKFPVDVLVLGNSHAYTGIDPEWLSAATDMTCFVLADLGVNLVDNHWALQEALELTQPQVVLIETTGMNASAAISETPVGLVNQLKAFHARSNMALKAKSSLELFDLDDLPAAWSKSVMNHHLWWTEPGMVRENIQRGSPYRPRLKELFLGGHTRFLSGLEDTTMVIYKERGGILDGAEAFVSDENQNAARNILELGQKHGFQVGFVTLPMFEDFLAHASEREAHLLEAIEPTGAPWINLQADTQLTRNPELFENTLSHNQHLTLKGALAVNQPIADWLAESFPDLRRPGKERDILWHQQMQVLPGYLGYHDPVLQKNPTIAFAERDVPINNRMLPWVVAFQSRGMKSEYLMVHARPPQEWFTTYAPEGLNVVITFDTTQPDGSTSTEQVILNWDDRMDDGERWLFRGLLPTCTINGLVRARFVLKS